MRFGSLGKKAKKPTSPDGDDDFEVENEMSPAQAAPAAVSSGKPSAKATGGSSVVVIPPVEEDPTPTTNKVLKATIDVRDDTINALKRTEGTLNLAEESGAESVKTLRNNDEVLSRSEQIADEMELRSMKEELAMMGRTLGRDKVFIVLSVMVVLAIAVAIALPFIKPHLDAADVLASGAAAYNSALNVSGLGPGELEHEVHKPL